MSQRTRILALSDWSYGRKITARTHREVLQRTQQVMSRHDVDGIYFGGNFIDRHHPNISGEIERSLDLIASLHSRFKVATLGINDLRDQITTSRGGQLITERKREDDELYFERFESLYRDRGIHLLDDRPYLFGELALVGGMGGFDGSLFEPVLDWYHRSDADVREVFTATQQLVEKQFARDHSWLKMTSAELFAQAYKRLDQSLNSLALEGEVPVSGILMFLHKAITPDAQIHHWHGNDPFKNYKDGATAYQKLLRDPRMHTVVAGARRRFFVERVNGCDVVDLSSSAYQPYLMEVDENGRLVEIQNYDELMADDPERVSLYRKNTAVLLPVVIDDEIAEYVTAFDYKYVFTDLFLELKTLCSRSPGAEDQELINRLRYRVRGLKNVGLSGQDLHRITDHIFCLYSYMGAWRNVTAWVKAIELDDILAQIGSIEIPYTPAWFVSKEPLPFFEVGQGDGDTAESIELELIKHIRRQGYSYDQILYNRHDNHPNFGIQSRESKPHWGEAAEYGDGVYCTRLEHGRGISGNYEIILRLNPKARRGTDFNIAFDIEAMMPYIVLLNAAAVTLVNEPDAQSLEHMMNRARLFGKYAHRTTTTERPIAL